MTGNWARRMPGLAMTSFALFIRIEAMYFSLHCSFRSPSSATHGLIWKDIILN